jgi:hypothetical protein
MSKTRLLIWRLAWKTGFRANEFRAVDHHPSAYLFLYIFTFKVLFSFYIYFTCLYFTIFSFFLLYLLTYFSRFYSFYFYFCLLYRSIYFSKCCSFLLVLVPLFPYLICNLFIGSTINLFFYLTSTYYLNSLSFPWGGHLLPGQDWTGPWCYINLFFRYTLLKLTTRF